MLKGILTPIITPFDKRDKVNERGFENLINFIRKAGINGFVVNGTTGIFSYLSNNERKKCIDYVLSSKNSEDKIIVGVGNSNYYSILDLINYCKNKEIEGILLPPPYYLKLDASSIVNFYKKIKKQTDLKIIIYNIPQLTNNPITPEILDLLIKEKIVNGIKDTSGNFTNFQKIIYLSRKDDLFYPIIGDDYLTFGAFAIGAKAGILGSSNFIPEIWNKFYIAISENKFNEAKKLQTATIPFIDAMFTGVFPASIYYILNKKGIDCGKPRFPIRELNEEEKKKLDSLIDA